MAGSSATMPAAGSAALPDVHLPGVNDPNCTSADRPVVLLPGTFSTVAGNFGALAAALQADGRCVYGLNYGLAGVAPVRDSAVATAGFVDDVRRATGADQVDVVAFSQGGLVLRTALRLDGAGSGGGHRGADRADVPRLDVRPADRGARGRVPGVRGPDRRLTPVDGAERGR